MCALLLAAAQVVNVWLLDNDVSAFDAGSGDSVFERLGTVAIAVAAGAAAFVALRRRSPLAHALLALLLTFLLVDDLLGVHEDLTGGAKLFFLVTLGGIFALLWIHPRAFPDVARVVRAGLVLLAFSFVFAEVAERAVDRFDWEQRDPGYELKVVLKDGAALAGWILIATGLSASALSLRKR